MAHGDAREGKWRGNWRMEWVASNLHITSEHGVSSIPTADAHTSAASSRMNWRPRRFKWTRPFRRKTKSGFCACAITFQLASTITYFKATGSRTFLLKEEIMPRYVQSHSRFCWAVCPGLLQTAGLHWSARVNWAGHKRRLYKYAISKPSAVSTPPPLPPPKKFWPEISCCCTTIFVTKNLQNSVL